MSKERLDEVGYWTEIKLQILQEYAKAYAQAHNATGDKIAEHVFNKYRSRVAR